MKTENRNEKCMSALGFRTFTQNLTIDYYTYGTGLETCPFSRLAASPRLRQLPSINVQVQV